MRAVYPVTVIIVAAAALAACRAPAGNAAVARVSPADAVGENKLEDILERGTLRVGTTGDYYMSYIDAGTQERRGFDIDLTRKLAADMGVDIEYVATDWASLVTGLTAGRYDITTGASYKPGRARNAAYTRPIARMGTVALIRQSDADRFTDWNSINQQDVTVAVGKGTVFEDQARILVPDAIVTSVASPALEYQEVSDLRADVAICSLSDAAALVTDSPSLQIAPVELKMATFVGLLVSQTDQTLLTFVNNWIDAQEYSGFIDELARKWNLDH